MALILYQERLRLDPIEPWAEPSGCEPSADEGYCRKSSSEPDAWWSPRLPGFEPPMSRGRTDGGYEQAESSGTGRWESVSAEEGDGLSEEVADYVEGNEELAALRVEQMRWDATQEAWAARLESSIRSRPEALEAVRWLYVLSGAESSPGGGEGGATIVRRKTSPRTRAIRRAARARREQASAF